MSTVARLRRPGHARASMSGAVPGDHDRGPVRVTICELPHGRDALESAWNRLCAHTRKRKPDVVVLPEFAFAEPVWEHERFDPEIWDAQLAACDAWFERLPELDAPHVIGARPATHGSGPANEGFHWSADAGYRALRCKHHLPCEPGGWEARWFSRGEAAFPAFEAGPLRFGLNICSELWALETYAGYAAASVCAIVSPRATAATTIGKWRAIGKVAAIRAGAFCISSNRLHSDGSCGGVGWVIDPDGRILALTSADSPFVSVDIDPAVAERARATYPRYVFAGNAATDA